MTSLFLLIDTILGLLIWVIIIQAIMSWLIAFQVVNLNNRFVSQVWYALNALTDPLLRPVRKVLPNMGGLDISPVVLILAIFFVRSLLREYGPL